MVDGIPPGDGLISAEDSDYFYSSGDCSLGVAMDSANSELVTLSGSLDELGDSDDSAVSQRVGRFEIIGNLGRGGFGMVYRAYDPQLDREVALKVPRKTMMPTQQDVDRFLREARAAATLRHPNICPVYEIGQTDGRHFFVMALIDGMTLGEKIRVATPFDDVEAARIVQSLARTLQFAHARGIVHRDIKPDNIMVDAETDELVIMDFGLASRANANDSRLTLTGQIIGTPAYMPPEQARGQIDAVGPAADIYSLGMILYELLTLQRPFKGSIADMLVQILHEQPANPSAVLPGVSEQIDAICMKAISKRIEDRFRSMEEFDHALTHFLQSCESTIVEIPVDEFRRQDCDNSSHQTANHPVRDESESFEELKHLIEESRRRGDDDQVLNRLRQLAESQDPNAVYYAEWAKNELVKLQHQSERIQREYETARADARELVERHNYGRAVQLLQSIPDEYRNDAFNQLWKQAISLFEEVRALDSDINAAIVSANYEGLLRKVERMLAINPDHRRAQELVAQLQGQEDDEPEPPPMRIPDFSQPDPQKQRQRKQWMLLIATMAIATAAFLYLEPDQFFSFTNSNEPNATGIQIEPLPSTSSSSN